MVSTPTRTTAARPAAGGATSGKSAGSRHAFGGTASPAGRPAVTPAARVRAWNRGFWSALEGTGKSRNGSTYYLILGSTLALTAIGIMMVLSASSVEAIAAGESPYSAALKQGGFAAIGVFAMFVLSRVNVVWLRRFAWPLMFLAIALLGLVLLVGRSALGNQNWIDVGPFTFQPSEAAKLALALWMATVLDRKAKLLHEWRHALIPVVLPGAIAVLGLILAGNDLGTAMIVMIIVAAALFFAGVRLYLFGIAGAVLALGATDPRRHEPEPDVPHPVMDRPDLRRRLRPELPVHQRPVRARVRRLVRRRTGPEPAEVQLDPGSAQRLHLRDHRRGTRTGRARSSSWSSSPSSAPPSTASSSHSTMSSTASWPARSWSGCWARPASTWPWSPGWHR